MTTARTAHESPDSATLLNTRIESIDVLRGLVMVIMAIDHVRDLFHSAAATSDPLNLATTTPILFFTRWITHFCAPVFVFLSGTSIYLQHLRKPTPALSRFLLKRGLWLIFAELVIVNLGMTFNPFYTVQILQVIWAIGISMVLLGLLIYLPFWGIVSLGVIIVLGHNALDSLEAAPGFTPGLWWSLAHRVTILPYATNHYLAVLYPFVPWFGLMLLGYGAGRFFIPTITPNHRRMLLTRLGLGVIVGFVALRFSNVYGNPGPWSPQKDGLFTLFSFIDLQKYPPSLLYMGMTIGPALLVLAWIERVNNSLTSVLRTFGRTAFFYYLIHWYLIHTGRLILFLAQGHALSAAGKIAMDNQNPFLFVVPGEGVSLAGVYLIWAVVIGLLYPLCRWYDAYKTSHRDQWWLSYL